MSFSIKYIKLNTKIVIANVVFLILFLIFSSAFIFILNSINNQRKIIDRANLIIQNLFLLRLSERNFFLFKDLQYIESNRENYKNLTTDIDQLLNMVKDPVFIEKIKKLKNFLSYYNETFDYVIELYKKKGLNDDAGLIGELRKEIHKVEDYLKNFDDKVKVSLLMLRRHEKDYLMRKNYEYVNKFGLELITMKNYIKNNKDINEKIDNYSSMFYKIVSIDKQIDDNKYRNKRDCFCY